MEKFPRRIGVEGRTFQPSGTSHAGVFTDPNCFWIWEGIEGGGVFLIFSRTSGGMGGGGGSPPGGSGGGPLGGGGARVAHLFFAQS